MKGTSKSPTENLNHQKMANLVCNKTRQKAKPHRTHINRQIGKVPKFWYFSWKGLSTRHRLVRNRELFKIHVNLAGRKD